MSDPLTHECGLALVRLRKPIAWFQEQYNDPAWGLRKLYLLMEKQHNRGQDGAGIATVRFDMPPGEPFLQRARSAKRNPVERLFDDALAPLRSMSDEALRAISALDLKRRVPLLGEVGLGHLRYGTFGGRSADACHPFLRRSIIASRNLGLAGNFNLTNSPELFDLLVEYGLAPVGGSDTGVVLEKIGYALDKEHDHLIATVGPGSFSALEGRPLAQSVSDQLDYSRILERATERFDGGYTLGGVVGNGDCFACRDPAGIRPAFVLITDEVVAVASERPALAAVFDVSVEQITALEPGHVLSVKRDGTIRTARFAPAQPIRQCSFERIYFSRGNDHEIYEERKHLGENLAPRILERLGGSIEHAVFSFIPNTAESAYLGLVQETERIMRKRGADEVCRLVAEGRATPERIHALMDVRVRAEKVAHKDQRLRTFITHDAARRDLVSHVYDITRGTVNPGDTLIAVDDSIVRGTTLRDSIITILSRLNPSRILVVSSAPPILYPDCYGIDMSRLGRFIAFEAAINLVRERGDDALLDEVESLCKAQEGFRPDCMKNHVRLIYDRFSQEELSVEIARLIRPASGEWTGAVEVIYQTVEGLRRAMPAHTGDWYFTGDYPTPGGYQVLNRAFLNWRRQSDLRSY
ncbi:MAG: amidophosphoribosyltransferase [Phycisphaerales bacterium]|nr:amidophosphoribosyltransferase [Phycisphaerales bacterium]